MSSLADRLLALAALRHDTVTLEGGDIVHVREASVLEQMEYNERKKVSLAKGLGYLIHRCVFHDDKHSSRVFTEEQGELFAEGRGDIAAPIIGKVLGFKPGEREKKAPLMEIGDSSTDSPPSSDDPSAS